MKEQNKGSKVSSVALIQSFLDWDILWLSFLSLAPHSCWRFEATCDCSVVSAVILSLALQPSPWTESSQINPEMSEAMWECGRTGEGLNLHLYMNVDVSGTKPIDMLRRWHANHRAREATCPVRWQEAVARTDTHWHRLACTYCSYRWLPALAIILLTTHTLCKYASMWQ